MRRSGMLPKSNKDGVHAKVPPKPRETRTLAPGEYQVLAAFRHTLRHFLSFSEAAAAEVGLAAQQYQALLAIKGCPGRDYVTINELANLLLIKHNSAVGLVNRLEAEGLVKRSVAREDRRKVNLRLTRKGSRVFERLAAVHRDELQRIGPKLSEFADYFSQARSEATRPKR
jgi:DNA-binding MarR family transcriptional regulator